MNCSPWTPQGPKNTRTTTRTATQQRLVLRPKPLRTKNLFESRIRTCDNCKDRFLSDRERHWLALGLWRRSKCLQVLAIKIWCQNLHTIGVIILVLEGNVIFLTLFDIFSSFCRFDLFMVIRKMDFQNAQYSMFWDFQIWPVGFFMLNAVKFTHFLYLLEANQNKNNCLGSNFYNKFKFFAIFSVRNRWEKSKRGKFQFIVKNTHKAVVLILISL